MKPIHLLLVSLLLFVIGACSDTPKKPLNDQSERYQLFLARKDTTKSLAERFKSLNRAFKIAQQQPLDSLSLAILSAKGIFHLNQKQPDSFFKHNQVLVKQSKSIDNQYFFGKAHFNLGYYYEEYTIHIDSAYIHYKNSKNAYDLIGDSTEVGLRLLSMAIIQKNQNDFFGAKETLTEALKYMQSSYDKTFVASIYNELGTNKRKLFNYSEAITYYDKAMKLTKNNNDFHTYKNNLAALYIEMGDYEKAIILLNQIIADSTLDIKSTYYARILNNLTYANWRNGASNVTSSFLTVLNIRKKKEDKRGLIASYTNVGEYFSKKDPQKAGKYLDSVIQLSKLIKMPRAETDALKFLMKLEPNNTTYKDRYIFLKDSLYAQELKVKTQFAKMRYDDQQEKAQILQLQAETSERKVQLAEEKTQKVLYLSLSALLVLGSTGLYYVLRQRHKKEKLQEVYSTEKKISQRLHDELSNDIFGLMATVEQVPDKGTGFLLDGLEKIYRHTRNISHDTREIATGDEFEEELRDLLGTFYTQETTVIVKGLELINWAELPDFTCVAIHRSLKELMVNMKKHSQASLVAVNFDRTKKMLQITYSDNGIGLDPEEKFGVGLKNTVSRIAGVNGKINFGPKEGDGTVITIKIPS